MSVCSPLAQGPSNWPDGPSFPGKALGGALVSGGAAASKLRNEPKPFPTFIHDILCPLSSRSHFPLGMHPKQAVEGGAKAPAAAASAHALPLALRLPDIHE
jgi:hypothetical protein